MRCSHCGRDAILFQRYSGLRLCGDHLRASLEARAKRTIRSRGGIRPGEKIAVAVSDDLISAALLHFLSQCFGMRRDLSLVAIPSGKGLRPEGGMSRIGGIAIGLGIEWAGGARDQEAGESPGTSRILPGENIPASAARMAGATKIALGTTLDEEAGSVFLAVAGGKASRLLRCPEGGRGGIPVLRPFSRVPEEEILLYAGLYGFGDLPLDRSPSADDAGTEAGRLLSGFTRRHPSALFSLANLGGRLAEFGCGPGREAPGPCTRPGVPLPRARPAHRRHDRVTGHE